MSGTGAAADKGDSKKALAPGLGASAPGGALPGQESKDTKDQPRFTFSFAIPYAELIFTEDASSVLGKGAFGLVRRGKWRGREVAVKELSRGQLQALQSESRAMVDLRSDYTVALYGCVLTEEARPRCFLVMQYLPGNALDKILLQEAANSNWDNDWKIRLQWIQDITAGLSILHASKIFHRDLKSANVLLYPGDGGLRAKLSDFGLASTGDRGEYDSQVLAPELLADEDRAYTAAADIYSLGMLLWEMAARKEPYAELRNDDDALEDKIVQEGYREKIPPGCPKALASLIQACWDADPAKRPLASEIVDYLKSGKEVFVSPRAELAGLIQNLGSSQGDPGDSKRDAKASTPWRVFQAPPATADFTGRTQLLKDLATALHQGRGGVISQGIAGSGGVGKTQLAARYVQLAAAGASCGSQQLAYDAVIWLYAERDLLSQFQSLVYVWFNLTGLSPQDSLLTLHQRLKDQRVLLVFDNAFEASSLTPILSVLAGGHYHILITSREQNWGAIPLLSLSGFSKEEGTAYVRQHLPDAKADEVTALLEALQYLPLAVKHAVAYIQTKACTLAEYPSKMVKLHALTRSAGVADIPSADKIVARTVGITLGKLQTKYPALEAVLEACAYFAPDAIPLSLLQAGLVGTKAGYYMESAVQESIAALLQYGLLQASGIEAVSIHRLVQGAAREWQADTQGQDGISCHLAHWVECLNRALTYEDKDLVAIRRIQDLIPHAWAVADACTAEEIADSKALSTEAALAVALLLSWVGNHQQNGIGDYHQALRAQERALAIKEKHYPADHPEVATALCNLAVTYRALGDPKRALPLEERSLAIKKKHYPADHPEVATALGNLALTYSALGDPKRALPLEERALAIKEKHYPVDHPSVAKALNNLALTYKALGDAKKALPLQERSLAIFEKHYPAGHPEVATALGNLAATYCALGDPKCALPLEERALAIAEKHYPADHPSVARALGNLAMTCRDIGDKAKARVLFTRAHEIYKLQADHVMTRAAAEMLASLPVESVVTPLEGKVSVPASFGRGSPIVSSPAMSTHSNANAVANRVGKSKVPAASSTCILL